MKKLFKYNLIILIIFGVLLIFNNSIYAASALNVPLFYGAVKIEIDKNVIDSDSFDVLDSRFRIFARDYEDGDLTAYISCTYNDVIPNTPGNYTLKYNVKDSDNNEVNISVNVVVNDKEEGSISVVRRTYAIPAMNNMKSIGMERCNTGDRQMLGIYLKSECSFSLRAIDAISKKTEVTFFTDTRNENSFGYINAGSTDSVVMQNVRNDISYNTVPLITSIRLDSEDVNTVYDYELSYNKDEALALDYYHYKDNEELFYKNWNTSLNDFALVDCEAIQMVVPIGDINNLGKTFKTLDDVCDYYIEVVNRMDNMVGLSFNPTNDYDFNYRTKYIAVCDKDYNAGAYYAGSYIAVCSSSIYGFFTYGWGSLHEIAHGYQGYFGKGYGGGDSLYFNETGNNVLAYYIQTDKTLYKDPGLWLGKMESVEESLNKQRLEGTYVFHNDLGTYTNVREKLYFILNLMNSFEGSDTYAKLFSYYRKIYAEYGNDKYTIIDIYAKFFKEYYNADILSYLDLWHLNLSNDVKKEIIESEAESFYIKNDYDESLASDGRLKYSLIKESDIKNKKSGSLIINVNFDICLNKIIGIFSKGNLVKQVKVTKDKLIVDNLVYGNYEIVFPTVWGYASDEVVLISINKSEQEVTYEYKKNEYEYDPSMKLWIRGLYPTVGFTLTLSSNNTKGTIVLGGANLGNQNNYWKNQPDTVYVSVTILDNDENIIKEYIVKGNNYFTAAGSGGDVSLEYGYKVKIYTQAPQYVNMWYGDNLLSDYTVSDNFIEYEICEYGFKLLNKESLDTKEVIYNIDKDPWISFINDYKNSVSDKELNNKSINSLYKEKVITYYNYLNDDDKEEFREFINKVKLGSSPNITILNNDRTIIRTNNIDLKSFISIYDNEDYYIDDYEIKTNLDINKVGSYDVVYNIYDSDLNFASTTLTFNVVYNEDDKVLIAAKDAKMASINALYANYSQSDYRTADWAGLVKLVNDAKIEVNAMNNSATIDGYSVEALKAKLDAIKTDATLTAEELEAAKDAKLKAIDEIILNFPDSNYRDSEIFLKNEYVLSIKDEISAMTSIDEVNDYSLDGFKENLRNLKTSYEYDKEEESSKTRISWKLLGIIMLIVFCGFIVFFIILFIILKYREKKYY